MCLVRVTAPVMSIPMRIGIFPNDQQPRLSGEEIEDYHGA